MNYEENHVHLTADNYDPKFLEEVVMQTCGLLGIYEIKEYHHLLEVTLALDPPEVDEHTNTVQPDFEIDFKPFNMDKKAGRVKLRPASPRAGKLMDQARAQKVIDRNPWLRRFHAIGFVRMVKRTREAVNNPKVQDFLLRNYNNSELLNLLDDGDRFKAHIVAKMRDDFTRAQLNAIFDLLPKVNEVMKRVPQQKHTNNEGDDQQQDAQNDPDKTADVDHEQAVASEDQVL